MLNFSSLNVGMSASLAGLATLIPAQGLDIIFWKRLFTGTVPVNKKYLTGTVPVNKKYLTGTVIRVGD